MGASIEGSKSGKNTIQIAIYGKGGIGKSTTSSNLTYGLASKGYRILQIGCDPKHDSTRNLLAGSTQPTVLNVMKEKRVSDINLDDLIMTAPCGVDCIESGGPEPGIGCAGRGIITAMNELKRLGLNKSDYDVVLYDVLGDVVCGGFAVPLRKDYSDVVYLVTSGEFMAIYAANNILRGIQNHSLNVPRVGGIILNCRGMEDEDNLVRRFSEAVGIPIVCRVSRDPHFAMSEKEGRTVVDMFPESKPAIQYNTLIDNVIGQIEGTAPRYLSNPLTDEELDLLLKGRPVRFEKRQSIRFIRIKPSDGEACAARAAAMSLSGIKDLTVVIHGPRACGYNMCNIRDVHFLGDVKVNPDMDLTFTDNMQCTDMDDADSIFGGADKLNGMLERLCSEGKHHIAIVTTCIPGIIGDDVGDCIRKIRSKYPDITILDVRTDGNLTGSAFNGMRMAREAIMSLIDDYPKKERGLVNVISTSGMNSGLDRRRIISLLDPLGYRLNTILFNECTVDDIRKAGRAEFNIPASKRDLSPEYRQMYEEHGLVISDKLFPCGFIESVDWLRAFENDSNKDLVEKYIESCTRCYHNVVERTSKVLDNKRVYLVGWLARPMDWMVDALKDSGATVVKAVMSGPSVGDPLPSGRHDDIPKSSASTTNEILADLEELKPDLVLGTVRATNRLNIRNGPLPKNTISFEASCDLLEYAADLIRAPVESSWKRRCCR